MNYLKQLVVIIMATESQILKGCSQEEIAQLFNPNRNVI